MNKLLLLGLLTLFTFNINGQDTVKIGSTAAKLYKGASSGIEDWFLYYKNDVYYMCKLSGKKEKHVKTWFESKIDSQNLYKGKVVGDESKSICLKKENDSASELNFFFQKSGDVIILISKVDGVKFTFNGV